MAKASGARRPEFKRIQRGKRNRTGEERRIHPSSLDNGERRTKPCGSKEKQVRKEGMNHRSNWGSRSTRKISLAFNSEGEEQNSGGFFNGSIRDVRFKGVERR